MQSYVWPGRGCRRGGGRELRLLLREARAARLLLEWAADVPRLLPGLDSHRPPRREGAEEAVGAVDSKEEAEEVEECLVYRRPRDVEDDAEGGEHLDERDEGADLHPVLPDAVNDEVADALEARQPNVP